MRVKPSVFLLLVLLGLASFSPHAAFAAYPLPDQSDTTQYVTHLISDYNAMVEPNSTMPDFKAVEGNFSLYQAPGTSFEVVVMQTAPSCAGDIAMVFFPIEAAQPQIRFDSSQTLADFAFGLSNVCGAEQVSFDDVIFVNATQTTNLDFIWVVNSGDITSNPLTAASSAAQLLYDQADAAASGTSQAQSSSTTSESTLVSSQTSSTTEPSYSVTSSAVSASIVSSSAAQTGGDLSVVILLAGVVVIVGLVVVLRRSRGLRRRTATSRLGNWRKKTAG